MVRAKTSMNYKKGAMMMTAIRRRSRILSRLPRVCVFRMSLIFLIDTLEIPAILLSSGHVPGYTILVLDTKVILSSLSAAASIIKSLRWTIVLPVPVILELDGLSSNKLQLGEAALLGQETW